MGIEAVATEQLALTVVAVAIKPTLLNIDSPKQPWRKFAEAFFVVFYFLRFRESFT